MSKTNKPHSALTVLSSTDLVAKDEQLTQLKTSATEQFAAISKMEGKAARCGILCGLTLHRLKASLPHGQFLPFVDQMWPKATFQNPATVRKSVSNYMRLAEVFVSKAKIGKPDILALPGDPLALEISDQHEAKQLLEKLDAFAGESSLNELLIKHGIKGVGLKKALEQEENDDNPPPPPPPPTAEQLYFQYRDEVGLIINRAESLFVSEGALAHLVGHPEELEGVAKGLRALADKVEKQVADLLAMPVETAAMPVETAVMPVETAVMPASEDVP